ncbi:pC147L [African swine fever virus]|uniref:PC147L n=1 Tax=African swine fever virus TaxID=10497 RepID=A0A8A1V4M2_ASF|nr:pC147L [African swine fever virus]
MVQQRDAHFPGVPYFNNFLSVGCYLVAAHVEQWNFPITEFLLTYINTTAIFFFMHCTSIIRQLLRSIGDQPCGLKGGYNVGGIALVIGYIVQCLRRGLHKALTDGRRLHDLILVLGLLLTVDEVLLFRFHIFLHEVIHVIILVVIIS